jgi:hypothetical protein
VIFPDNFPTTCPVCGAPFVRDDEFYREFECGTDVSAFDGEVSQDEPCKRRMEEQHEATSD